MKKLSVIMSVVLLLSACSGRYSSSGENLYLQSRNGRSLEVPKPLTREYISDFYSLPAQDQDAQVSSASPVTQ